MDSKYQALFTPWKIGNVEIKNRIVMCPMGGTSLFGWFELTGCHFDKEAAKLMKFTIPAEGEEKQSLFLEVILAPKFTEEAKEELLSVHKYLYKQEDLGDFYYFVGNYCYKFINKDYEYVMYQKSYSLNPIKELYEELKEIKPLDRDLEFDNEAFLEIANKEGIPTGFIKEIENYINKE